MHPDGFSGFVNLVLPTGTSVRRRAVPTRTFNVGEAISFLLGAADRGGADAPDDQSG